MLRFMWDTRHLPAQRAFAAGTLAFPVTSAQQIATASRTNNGIRPGGLPCLRHARTTSFNTNPDTDQTFEESCLHRKEDTDLKGYTDFTGNEFLHGSQHDWVTNFLPFTVSFHFPIQSRGFASLCMGIVWPNSVHLEIDGVTPDIATKTTADSAGIQKVFLLQTQKRR